MSESQTTFSEWADTHDLSETERAFMRELLKTSDDERFGVEGQYE